MHDSPFAWKEIGKLAAICILLFFLMNLIISAGCITAAKTAYADATATPAPTPAPTPLITVSPTPQIYATLDESYTDWKYRMNGHALGEEYTWRRDDVSGLKDMLVHVTTYGYRMEPNYRWWSVSWGRYFWQVPADGMKYVFVYVNVWMDGDSPRWDPRMYGFDWQHFRLQVGDILYAPDTTYVSPNRIKELEETWNRWNTTRIGPFGCLRLNDRGYESCIGEQYVRMGKENGLDGFILFEVPKESKPADMKMIGSYRGFGSAWWELK